MTLKGCRQTVRDDLRKFEIIRKHISERIKASPKLKIKYEGQVLNQLINQMYIVELKYVIFNQRWLKL